MAGAGDKCHGGMHPEETLGEDFGGLASFLEAEEAKLVCQHDGSTMVIDARAAEAETIMGLGDGDPVGVMAEQDWLVKKEAWEEPHMKQVQETMKKEKSREQGDGSRGKWEILLDGGQGKTIDDAECLDAEVPGDDGTGSDWDNNKERTPRRRRRRQRRRLRQRKALKQRWAREVPSLDGDDSSSDESESEKETEKFEEWAAKHPGLQAPRLRSGQPIDGSNKRQHRRENKAKRIEKQKQQAEQSYWNEHEGTFCMPESKEEIEHWRGQMCPRGLALHHPAAGKLLQYATGGCPSNTGKNWTRQQMQEAVERGPHSSALEPDAIEQLRGEIEEKVRIGHAKVVAWNDIKDDPPPELKISPIAMIPHKSRKYRAILDLSFQLRLKDGSNLTSVNDGTTLSAPAGAIDQLGHSLSRIIHAFAETDPDEKIFMAKFDVKDGFWRMMCEEGQEWNFAYVLPQEDGKEPLLVVPLCLQMGWVESPPYFCAASETARDVAAQYVERPVGTLPQHKFEGYTMGSSVVQDLPEQSDDKSFRYFLDVYVDDFISLAVATSREQLRHLGRATMHGAHDVFPAASDDEDDPVSLKKLKKKEGEFDTKKEILGFDFDGEAKTMNLAEGKLELLLTTLHKWVRHCKKDRGGIPFPEFRTVMAKCRNAFRALPAGRGLLTEVNKILGKEPPVVYLQRSKSLLLCIEDARRLLRESGKRPTPCSQLVMGEAGYVGVKDASVHGVGGVIVGHKKACTPTVFRMEWPQDIKEEVWKTNSGKKGKLTNSDLECAGLLLLWLVMEEVCNLQDSDHVALFSDNSPTVSWVERMSARGSLVAGQLLRALALRQRVRMVSPLTTLHIEGSKNDMTDIPSRSFGSEPKWYCKNNKEFLTMYNSLFPLPNQESWTVFQLSTKVCMRVISLLRMQVITMDEWQRLPKAGRFIGEIGASTAYLWEWTLSFRVPSTTNEQGTSQDSQRGCDLEALVEGEKSKLTQSRLLSRPLAKRSRWCME